MVSVTLPLCACATTAEKHKIQSYFQITPPDNEQNLVIKMPARIQHPTESDAMGPFLIDRSQLESLDVTLNNEWARLEEVRGRELNDEIEKKLHECREQGVLKNSSDQELRDRFKAELTRYEYRSQRGLVLTLRGGRSAHVTDFAAALREPGLTDQSLTGFYIQMESGKRSCSVMLSSRYSSQHLKINVKPAGDAVAEQMLSVLKNWQDSVRPARWLRIWQEVAGLHWGVFGGCLGLTTMILGWVNASVPQGHLREQASALLNGGIQPEKYGPALELILKATINVQTAETKPFPLWYKGLFYGGLLYCILLSIYPKVVVAVGQGGKSIVLWRRYTGFVAITLPLYLFVNFAWPNLEHWLKALLGL